MSPYFTPGAWTPEMVASMATTTPGYPEAVGDRILMGPGGTQSYDRFKAQYQARTGDVTGDPFLGLGDRNVSRVYNQAVADDWSNRQATLRGVPVATAGRVPLGPAAPTGSPAVAAVAARGAAPVATLQPDATAIANQQAYYMRNPEARTQGVLQDPRTQEVLQSLGVQQPSPDAAAAVLARTGMMPETRRYNSQVETNEESPNYGMDVKLLNDPKFQQLRRLDSVKAGEAYFALTGQYLSDAEKAITARHQDREKLDDMMVSRLANDISVDPKTNQFAKRVRVQKKASFADRMQGGAPEYEDQYVPLNPVEQKWIQSGAFERKTGINLRDMLAQRTPAGPPTNDPRAAAAYSEALKRTGNEEYAQLAAMRGTTGPAYMENPMNPEFQQQENMNPLLGMISPIYAARVAGEQIGSLLGR